MFIDGHVREDEPDPRERSREESRAVPVLVGLVPQPHVEESGGLNVGRSISGDGTVDAAAVSINYRYWRNPSDRDDPANLAHLDPATLRQLDEEPPWPLPPWLLEAREAMRYPTLWECVRTSYRRDPACAETTPASQLVAHVNHILMNRFRDTRVVGEFPGTLDSPVDERHVERDVAVRADGRTIDGVRLDTDPDVTGLAARLGPDLVFSAVVERDVAHTLTIDFATRANV
jgi:hypothetical protein